MISLNKMKLCPECIKTGEVVFEDNPAGSSYTCRDCRCFWGLVIMSDGRKFTYQHSGAELRALENQILENKKFDILFEAVEE